jgi:GT2 family glycosyltransferase
VAAGPTATDAPFGFCGAGALLDVAAVRSCGGMDASLFLYYEDTDLSWRLRLAGWSVEYCPAAHVMHEHGSSSVEGSDLFLHHNERNRLLVLARNATARTALWQWLRYR